jgi:hypothetical protein
MRKIHLTFVRNLLCRKETKIILISTVCGGVVQTICRRYIKSHPEFLEKKNNTELEVRNPRFRHFFRRGGTLVGLSGPSIKAIANVLLTFLAEKGLLTGALTGAFVIVKSIPTNAINAYLQDAFPQNLPELEKKKCIFVEGEKISLDQCDENIRYLFSILRDEKVPFKEKQKLTRSTLTRYLNLQTADGRVSFVLCIVVTLYIFSITNMSSYYIIIKNLIKAVKEGRVPKVVARAIIRKLKRRGLLIDPELIEVVNS